MSTPTDPLTPSTPPVPTPPTPLTASGDQIRQLAAQLNQPAYNFDPSTIRKAVLTAIDPGNATTPPTGTILFSGDTTSPVSGVRLAADYAPNVGDTVIVLKQGSDFFMLTDIANAGSQTASSAVGGWTQATLNGSHTHNGNSNGNLMYRRILEQGCWKMQWKGAINYGGTTTVLSAALDSDHRPSSKQSVIVARDVNNGGAVAIGVDFNTDGTVTIVAPTWSTGSAGGESTSGASPGGATDSIDPLDSTTSDQAGSVAGSVHSHGVVGAHSHSVFVDNHWHGNGNHIHTASNPTWIAFTNTEYFL